MQILIHAKLFNDVTITVTSFVFRATPGFTYINFTYSIIILQEKCKNTKSLHNTYWSILRLKVSSRKASNAHTNRGCMCHKGKAQCKWIWLFSKRYKWCFSHLSRSRMLLMRCFVWNLSKTLLHWGKQHFIYMYFRNMGCILRHLSA